MAIVIPETQQPHGEGSMSLSASAFLIWSLADNLEAVVRWLAHLLMLKQLVYRGIALQIERSCHHL